MFPLIGIVMFPAILALVEYEDNSSFNLSNSSADFSSWVNTLMTFKPLMDSSILPSTAPIALCCLMKYLLALPPINLVFKRTTPVPIKTTRVIQTLLTSIKAKLKLTAKVVRRISGNDWEINWRIVSISLV